MGGHTGSSRHASRILGVVVCAGDTQVGQGAVSSGGAGLPTRRGVIFWHYWNSLNLAMLRPPSKRRKTPCKRRRNKRTLGVRNCADSFMPVPRYFIGASHGTSTVL